MRPLARGSFSAWLLGSGMALASCHSPDAPAPQQTSHSKLAAATQEPTPATAAVSSAAPAPTFNKIFSSSVPVSLWIRGGKVVDGTGDPARPADVVVNDDRIVFVGEVAPDLKAKATLDAAGMVVAPGFVDVHAHSDPLKNVDHLLAMGVTTIVVGQDGSSEPGGVASYLAKVAAANPRVNVATLVGHATVRSETGVGSKLKPSKDQLAEMAQAVAGAMEEGAFGLSTGLEYDPGGRASAAELAAIAKPVGDRGGIVMSHMRSEDDDRVEASIDELLAQCKASGAKAHVAHLKLVLGHGAARAKTILAKLAEARADGLTVTADIYPYTASYTTIAILFPAFARPPNDYAKARVRKGKDLLEHLRKRVEARNGPGAMLFGTGRYANQTLEKVAKSEARPFENILADLGPTGAAAAYFVMDESVMKVFMADPFVMFGTDGSTSGPHPRGHGTFARIFHRYVGEVLPLESAVRKASALAVESIGLGERGVLKEGALADVVVFDPEKFEDHATFAEPLLNATGMKHVVVGGVVEWRDGAAISGRGGRALRHKSVKK